MSTFPANISSLSVLLRGEPCRSPSRFTAFLRLPRLSTFPAKISVALCINLLGGLCQAFHSIFTPAKGYRPFPQKFRACRFSLGDACVWFPLGHRVAREKLEADERKKMSNMLKINAVELPWTGQMTVCSCEMTDWFLGGI